MSIIASTLNTGAIVPKHNLSFVGKAQQGLGSGQQITVDMSSVGLQHGDTLIASQFFSDNTSANSGLLSLSGNIWTEIHTIGVSETSSVNHRVSTGVYQGGTTSFVSDRGTATAGRLHGMQIMAFRNVHKVNLGSITFAPNSDDLTWLSAGTTRIGDYLVLSGAVAHTGASLDFAATAYTNLVDYQQMQGNSSYDITAAQGYRIAANNNQINPDGWNIAATASSASESGVILILS